MAGGRKGKRGLTRMHAALDHLCGVMGFPKDAVKEKIKELLKEYGGPDGWVFIEESSYQLLIEQLLKDKEGSEPSCPLLADAASQENMHGDAASSSAVGPSNASANLVPDMVQDVDKTFADGDSYQESAVTSTDDVLFTQQDVTDNEYDVCPPAEGKTPSEVRHSPPLPPRQQKANHAPTSPPPPEMEYVPPPPPPPPEMEPSLPRVRRPCYGWWGEETEVIMLPEMPIRVKGAR